MSDNSILNREERKIDERLYDIRNICWDYLLQDKLPYKYDVTEDLDFVGDLIEEYQYISEAFCVSLSHPINSTDVSILLDLMTVRGLDYNIKDTPIFNGSATTEIYTLSLHDALQI